MVLGDEELKKKVLNEDVKCQDLNFLMLGSD